MSPVEKTSTLAQLVLERPARARVLEQVGLDYCCGGKRTLEQACTRRGLDADAIVAAIGAGEGADPVEGEDWTRASLTELCDHIVASHHDRLREELPRLSTLLTKVARVHGAKDPALHELAGTFEGMRAVLEAHMDEEEREVFPACRALDGVPGGNPTALAGVGELEAEHEQTGAALERIRALAGGFELDRAFCNTHRVTLDALRELELDLHQHIHEENNVLFPRALETARAA